LKTIPEKPLVEKWGDWMKINFKKSKKNPSLNWIENPTRSPGKDKTNLKDEAFARH
jgi:hypothetical protein